MIAWERVLSRRFARAVALCAILATLSRAAPAHEVDGVDPASLSAWPVHVIPGAPELSTLYHDGSEILVQTEERWRLICGSDPTGITSDDLARFAAMHHEAMATGPTIIIDSGVRTTGLNIVFSTNSTVPADAVVALGLVEAYLESLFADPITVDISVVFGDLGGGGVIGATSANFVNGVSYTNSRNGLAAGMDGDDVIQSWLPTGTTIPVRYNGGSSTVTNENQVTWTRANYKSTIGNTSGFAASMTFNTQFAPSFDYNPVNGVPLSKMSFVDVAVHEVGHALGFISAVDFSVNNMDALDIFRFQFTDGGSNDYNPDNHSEFQVRPRLVDWNTPDDDVHSDLIAAEYRMSDGDPWQGSHFREGGTYIGLMDPAIGFGETHYPNYFTAADIAMFDAIGYNYPPCTLPVFLQQPQNASQCAGTTIQLSVQVDLANAGYQWRIGTTNLVDDGVHIAGATTATLSLINVTPADVSDLYNCQVTNLDDGCVAASNFATVGVFAAVQITTQPNPVTVTEMDNAFFSVAATGAPTLTYQWRRNGVNLVNGGGIIGATSTNLSLLGVFAQQAGDYDCVVTNPCGSVPSNPAHLTVLTGYGAGPGDMDCSGAVSFADINPFVLALASGENAYYVSFPNCHWYNADVDSNGEVGFSDINPFVALLSGQ